MARTALKGNPVDTTGELPAVGSKAPQFILTKADLSDVSLADFAGKRKLLSIVPSLDTGVCAASTRRFEAEAASVPGAVLLVVSADLPFAQKRFCDAEGIGNVVTLSELRSRDFGRDYGVRIAGGPLAGLLARAIVVLDAGDRVVHTQLVPEITTEPDYANALAALRG